MPLIRIDLQKYLDDLVHAMMFCEGSYLAGIQLNSGAEVFYSEVFRRTSSKLEYRIKVESEYVAKLIFFLKPGIINSPQISNIKKDLLILEQKFSKSIDKAYKKVRCTLLNEILEILNSSIDKGNSVKEILGLVKNTFGLDAVGVRFKDGHDYPYFEVIGFSDHFIEKENYLCAEDSYESDACPELACMCGNIIQGRVDSSFPFFTEGGSFWSNCTTELLKTTTNEDRQAVTRNRCNSAGYESVALVPLRGDSAILGLLQLNAKKRSSFTLEMIKFFERVAALITIAIERMYLTKRLEMKEKILNDTLRELEIKNLTTQELINQFERQKETIKDDMQKNIENVVLPALERLSKKNSCSEYYEIFRDSLADVTSSYGRVISTVHNKLSNRELEICNMIKSCLSSKEISNKLNISLLTVEKHRTNIRKKLGISNKDQSLAAYLHAL